MVQATNEELLAYYGATPWVAIQWHGMAVSTCANTDVYPSHGRDVPPEPTDKIAILRGHLLLQHPTWDVDLPGSGSCSLNATDNVQGRLLNGVAAASVCGTEASSIHRNSSTSSRIRISEIPATGLRRSTSTFP